ncbi:MAG TPA: glycosyltransferase [Edaphocola sp.]|nr:glycosyltransferase [Edaphocola sp.]
MKILQIASEVNIGSVGKIAEQIGEQIIAAGGQSYIAWGRDALASTSESFRIGSQFDVYHHVFFTRISDKHGLASKKVTKDLIKKIEAIKPQIIHLHHLHGYYINYKILFEYLAKSHASVIWTFHDCWSFTGHCSHYEYVNCQKWQDICYQCPQTQEYPKAFVDRSTKNFEDKKVAFCSVENLTIVPVSYWLAGEVKKSYLKNYPVVTIQNGIDVALFHPMTTNIRASLGISASDFLILGVAYVWDTRKGYQYFMELSSKLNENETIVLVGLSQAQIKNLPSNIVGLKRTNSATELAEWYATADVFVNPTLEDTFPTTNLEALACGTPVVTFKSGGAPETIDDQTGIVVAKGNGNELLDAIRLIKLKGKASYSLKCRERAELHFNKKENFKKYLELYKKILNK